jgi:hypothetical protein
MIIGIISDSHNNLMNLKKAINILTQKGMDILIHCGDLCSAYMVEELSKSGVMTYLAYGNMDKPLGLKLECEKFDNVNYSGEIGKIRVDGMDFSFCHYPHSAKKLAEKGIFKAVFHGHTHIKAQQTVGPTLLLNPGEIKGMYYQPTCAFYDTRTGKAGFIDLI